MAGSDAGVKQRIESQGIFSNSPSSQRRLGPSPANFTSKQHRARNLIRFCSGLGPSLRWDDEWWNFSRVTFSQVTID